MASLETTYLGIPVKNPVVVASSGLTARADQVAACEKAGAGAVVLKSIFEEHIRRDYETMDDEIFYGISHPEAYEYFHSDMTARSGAHVYCEEVEAARKAVSIPVIASINCYSESVWVDFARDLESAGAGALELNISYPPVTRIMEDPASYLKELAHAVRNIAARVSIPVSIKLPPAAFFVGSMARTFADAGARGLILFNRFMAPAVNIDTLKVEHNINFSGSSDSDMARRFIALLQKRLPCELIGAGGVHTPEDAISLICVGAHAVQIASVLYQKGLMHIQLVKRGIASWMEKHGYSAIEDFRGCLATDPSKRENPFGRFQYIRMMEERVPDLKPSPFKFKKNGSN